MNTVVEVATAETVAEAPEVIVGTYLRTLPVEVKSIKVATSTTHTVVSLGSHSISAVAPDNTIFGKELAVA